MRENTRKRLEGSGKKKMGFTTGVNYQEDTPPKRCMDGMTGSSRGNI